MTWIIRAVNDGWFQTAATKFRAVSANVDMEYIFIGTSITRMFKICNSMFSDCSGGKYAAYDLVFSAVLKYIIGVLIVLQYFHFLKLPQHSEAFIVLHTSI